MYEEQLKQRFIKEGLQNFEADDIIKLLLIYSKHQENMDETIHCLLNRFGSISEVFDAPFPELMNIEGMDEDSAVLISAIPQFSRKYIEDKSTKSEIRGIESIAEFASKCFIGMTTEHFFLICVDNKLTMLNYHLIAKGSVDSTNVDLRKIIYILLGSNATAAVIAHNHPRGNSMPSRQNLKTTLTIASALKLISIKLLDHVIVGVNGYTSMAEHPKKFGCYLTPV